jgi:hypothetical protein
VWVVPRTHLHLGQVQVLPGSRGDALHFLSAVADMAASHTEQGGYVHALQTKASLSFLFFGACCVFKCASGFWPHELHTGNWQSRHRAPICAE